VREVVRNSAGETKSSSDKDVNAPERQLDNESVTALREFFALLDQWDQDEREKFQTQKP
jgi:hypothetical protein